METASNLLGFAVVAFTILAALSGVIHWVLSKIVAARKDAALAEYQSRSSAEIAAAAARAAEANENAARLNERAAKAELSLAETALKLEQVRNRQAPRSLGRSPSQFGELLRGTRSGEVEQVSGGWRSPQRESDPSTNRVQARIYFLPQDDEAFMFAEELRRALDKGAGWDAESVSPFPDPKKEVHAAPVAYYAMPEEDLPPMTRLSGRPLSGVTIFAQAAPQTIRIFVGQKP